MILLSIFSITLCLSGSLTSRLVSRGRRELSTAVEYARGETGIDACPAGKYLITDAQACENAATALGLAYNSDAADGDVFAVCNWCADCDPQDVRLDNKHGDNAEWICSNIPTPDPCTLIQCANGGTCSGNQCHCTLGYFGTLCEQGTGWNDNAEYNLSTDGTCPEGFRKVSDSSECEWFRDTRFTIRGRKVGSSFHIACNVHWPTHRACFMGPNNNVAYAQHTCNPGAPKPEKFQVICKRNWYNYVLKSSLWDGTCQNNAAQLIREYNTWSRFECALHCVNDRWCWFFHIGVGKCGLYRSCDKTRTLPLGQRVDTYRLKIDRAPSYAPSAPPTPLTFSFSVKGARGSEKIRYNGVEYSLTKTWREFTGIIDDRIEIEFFNDNGDRNVRFDSEHSYNARLPSMWASWNCWGPASGRNERCQHVKDGKFKWNGVYKIRFFADSDD